jgi:hypothetical protein
MAEPLVSYRLVRSCLRYLRERIGEPALTALAEVDAPAVLSMATPAQPAPEWVPLRTFAELLERVEVRHGDPATHRLVREMTRATMAAAISSVWATFFADATPESMLERATQLWSLSYDAGRLVVLERGPRRARLAIEGWPGVPEVVGVLLGEASAVIVARLGGRAPRAVTSRSTDRIELEIDW